MQCLTFLLLSKHRTSFQTLCRSGNETKITTALNTLSILLPDEILGKIREAGFKVAMQREVHLTKEQAEEFYSEHQGQEYFEELTTRMSR